MNYIIPAFAAFSLLAAPASGQASDHLPKAAKTSPSAVAASPVDPQSLALARSFVDLLYPVGTWEEDYLRMVRSAAAETVDEVDDLKKRAATRDSMERYLANAAPILKQHLPRIKEAYANIFAREFRVDELQQMISFASTPAGRHFLQSSDLLENDPAMGEATNAMMRDLAPLYDQFYAEQCQKSAQARLAAGDKNARCNRA